MNTQELAEAKVPTQNNHPVKVPAVPSRPGLPQWVKTNRETQADIDFDVILEDMIDRDLLQL